MGGLIYCPPNAIPVNVIKHFQERIRQEYGGEINYDPDAYAKRLSSRTEAIASIQNGEIEGAVFGYCNDLSSRVGFISYIARVRESEKHTAYRLHEAFAWFCKGRCMDKLRLEVLRSNVHAQHFYDRLGYRREEVRSNSYIMIKSI